MGEGSLSTYAHMESLGPGEVNTMRSYLGTVLDGGEGVTQTQVEGGGGGGTRYQAHTKIKEH